MRQMSGVLRSFLRRHRGWIFPICLLVAILLLSGLQLSGTSSGVYDHFFGRDTSGQVGQPRTVRSDEWVVTTPFTAAQYHNGMPVHSADVGAGQDMSLVVDVPYADWSVLFRPQNLAFFVAPLETAFAFKWWFLAALLSLAVYAFFLLLYPGRHLSAVLVAGTMLLSPFIQWWYQSITILPIAYGLLCIVLLFRLLRAPCLRQAGLWALGLGYVATCFVLLMYPAFQIAVGLVVVGVTLALLWAYREFHLLWRRRNLVLLVTTLALVGGVVGLFLVQHLDTIKATLATVYPGARQVVSGGFDIFRVLNWPFGYLLQDQANSMALGTNQSEASNFLLIGLVLAPILVGLHLWRPSSLSRVEAALLYTCLGLTGLVALRMFVPFGSEAFALLGLGKVPHVRLLIALGLINCLLLMIVVGRPGRNGALWRQVMVWDWRRVALVLGVVLGFVALYGLWGYALRRHYQLSGLVGPKELAVVALALGLVSTLLLSSYQRLRLVGLVGLVLLGVGYAGLVNPLYRGLGMVNNAFAAHVRSLEPQDNLYWVAHDSPQLSAVLLANGAEVQGGVNTYPQLAVWRSQFGDQADVFNRYAHVRFVFDPAVITPRLELIQSDSFFVHVSPCHPFVRQLSIGYIVAERPLPPAACLAPDSGGQFDGKQIYIYRLRD